MNLNLTANGRVSRKIAEIVKFFMEKSTLIIIIGAPSIILQITDKQASNEVN